jgi:hypothetical protein
LSQGADHEHDAQENELDRGHEAMTTAATLSNQRQMARERPQQP